MKTILCVEDSRTLMENHRSFFSSHDYHVLTAANLAQAREQLQLNAPDAVLLDIMLPDGSGLDLLSELRSAGYKFPIIMVTSFGEPEDISRGYLLGATAYLAKPFDYQAVLAAVESIFTNIEQLPETINRGRLLLKLITREAYVDGVNIELTPKDYSLLQFFVQNTDRQMSSESIYEAVWGKPMAGDSQSFKSAVSRLRKKLRGCGYTISNEYGGRYCFERGEP